jgi:hypothetical protein
MRALQLTAAALPYLHCCCRRRCCCRCRHCCRLPRNPPPPTLKYGQVLEGDTFYEFLVDERSWRWQHWRERIPAWEYPAGVERPRFTQLVIPTLDSVRYEHLLGLVHSVGRATLVSADCGSGTGTGTGTGVGWECTSACSGA